MIIGNDCAGYGRYSDTWPGNGMRSFYFAFFLLALTPLFAGNAALLIEERLCDQSEQICLQGVLNYARNENHLVYTGRLKNDVSPGEIRMTVAAYDKQELLGRWQLYQLVKGNNSEPVEMTSKVRLDAGNRLTWQVESLAFISKSEQ